MLLSFTLTKFISPPFCEKVLTRLFIVFTINIIFFHIDWVMQKTEVKTFRKASEISKNPMGLSENLYNLVQCFIEVLYLLCNALSMPVKSEIN